MDEMRVWDGVKESSKKKCIHGLVMWTKLGDDKLAKRAGAQKVEGKWSRRRAKLRWWIALKVT